MSDDGIGFKRRCVSTTCYLRDVRVHTEIERCLACGQELQSDLDLLGMGGALGDLLGWMRR